MSNVTVKISNEGQIPKVQSIWHFFRLTLMSRLDFEIRRS
jgi:hypothetical protein